MTLVPTIDATEWRDPSRRDRLAETLDACLRDPGMFLLQGHGLPPELTARVRSLGRQFFGLSHEQKSGCAVQVPNGNGWHGPRQIRATAYQGIDGPPDLHESLHVGPTGGPGDDPTIETPYQQGNRWPVELPELPAVLGLYTEHMGRIAREVLTMCAEVLGDDPDLFTRQATRATWRQNLNWYPPVPSGGLVAGEMQVGPHNDFGSVSLVERQFRGNLEVWSPDRGWFVPPWAQGSLTVIVGQLLHRWTDGRWRALRHRVVTGRSDRADEGRLSLAYFFDLDPDYVVDPLPPPAGGGAGMTPLLAGESIKEKVRVTTTQGPVDAEHRGSGAGDAD